MVAVVAAAVGCSESEPSPAATPAGPSSAASSTSSSQWSTSSGPNDAQMSEEPPAGASPTWDRASREDAAATAVEVMTAFARPELQQGRWWRDLAPMLTPSARTTYQYVAVENVPAREVRGEGEVVDDSSPYLTSIEVKTDVGTYTVLLARTGQDAPWLAERIEPSRDSS